jgi:uncharacterized protein YozE (UPF0346 family)
MNLKLAKNILEDNNYPKQTNDEIVQHAEKINKSQQPTEQSNATKYDIQITNFDPTLKY